MIEGGGKLKGEKPYYFIEYFDVKKNDAKIGIKNTEKLHKIRLEERIYKAHKAK